MSDLQLGMLSIPILLIVIFMRMSIGLAMLMVDIIGTGLIIGGPTVALAQLKNQVS
jgi:C4-dicarboxylate transporter DctM subunit